MLSSSSPSDVVEIRHFHLFAGSGGGAIGFNRGHAREGRLVARMRCIGGVDVDAGACRDFTRLVGTPATCLDLFSEAQYRAFHGEAPPAGWREATAADIRAAAGGESPDIVFLSAPCKGFSGLLNARAAASRKYQALNELTVRGVRLMLEAFADAPPGLVVFENVPRIMQRGRALLDDIQHELELGGFAVRESTHDCGELGALAQHRRRYLLVARHTATVPAFLYEPPRRAVHGVGEVIGRMPMPEAAGSGPMHRLPRCTWETYIRLALIQPGKDARSLHAMDLSRLGIQRLDRSTWGAGCLGVVPFDAPAGAVAGESRPTNGAYSVGDVRPMAGRNGKGNKYPVTAWSDATRTVIGANGTGDGACGLGDIRLDEGRFNNVYRVIRYDEPSAAVTAGAGPSSGGISVGDVRIMDTRHEVYGVTGWAEPCGAVTSKAAPGSGHWSVGDVRPGPKRDGEAFASSGHYGVVAWGDPSRAVIGSACHDNGYHSVGDPRLDLRRSPETPPVILSLWNTWNRPFTTLELAALQGYPWEELTDNPLDGTTDTRWRLHIGNSVPPPAAEAMASAFAHAILLSRAGVSFRLSATPIWVRRHAVALSLPA